MACHPVTCARCGRVATLSQPGKFCRPACRVAHRRELRIAARADLAARAERALATGDVVDLERVARTAVELLAA